MNHLQSAIGMLRNTQPLGEMEKDLLIEEIERLANTRPEPRKMTADEFLGELETNLDSPEVLAMLFDDFKDAAGDDFTKEELNRVKEVITDAMGFTSFLESLSQRIE